MGKGIAVVPLTETQIRILALLAENRSVESHIAGATGFLMGERSPRRSHDLDLFHDRELAVAEAFAADRHTLEGASYAVEVQLSQPGFIRAVVVSRHGDRLRIDWAHDSAWRFLPPVKVADAGYVLHPVDLAVNKVLALAGRDEPRDLLDTLYLHDRVLPLGALCWAACGKDPGLNPQMLLDLLSRKGRLQQEDVARLDLSVPIDAAQQALAFRRALQEGKIWSQSRPADEAGCLYRRADSGLFFAPRPDDEYRVHRGAPGGILPVYTDQEALVEVPAARRQLEAFFERRVG